MVVLGISLGSRTTGIAILRHAELLEYRTLTVRSTEAHKHASAIARYVVQYRIVTVAVKVPPSSHMTEKLREILKCFVTLFSYHGCMVEYKSDEAIKRHIPSVRNKAELIGFVSRSYTALAPVYARELASRQRYHYKMFEAVAVAHIVSQK